MIPEALKSTSDNKELQRVVLEWKLYVQESLTPDIYWFRLPEATYGGVICRPEFAMDIITKHDGCRDRDMALPKFANWTGWRWELPANLEYRIVAEGEVNPRARGNQYDIVIPSIELKECPFCGGPSKLICDDYDGQGARLYSYIPKPNIFFVKCESCMISGHARRDLAIVQSNWNNRVAIDKAKG